MPKPYSYDLRQKVIQAIQLDGMNNISKSSVQHQPQHHRFMAEATSGNRRLSSGAEYLRQRAENYRLGEIREFAKSMGTKSKLRWQHFGTATSALVLFHEALKKIGLTRKKNLRLPGTG